MFGSIRNMCAVTIALTTMIGQATANDGPSYEETVQFVLDRTQIRTAKGVNVAISFPKRCILLQVSGEGSSSVTRTKVNLAQVNPESVVNWKGLYVVAKTSDMQPVIQVNEEHFAHGEVYRDKLKSPGNGNFKFECDSKSCVNNHTRADFSVRTFDREENLPRLKRALTHLVNLCGGKAPLF